MVETSVWWKVCVRMYRWSGEGALVCGVKINFGMVPVGMVTATKIKPLFRSKPG